ncbi:MAG: hypothetical protein NT116_03695, partial [Candidatus Parcubacteria bacterium]|nr:hypothetical protein [Candidatus Parcubacteria bacterium]
VQICGVFVELFKLIPAPRDMGRFFIAFRKKWQRKCRVLYSGLTQSGADRFPKKIDPAAILEQIALKRREKQITLKRQGEKYILH